jgi:signal peptidase I
MARKSRTKAEASSGSKSDRGKQAAKVGLWAFLLSGLVWLTGGFTRENGWEWIKSIGIAVGLALLIRWPVGEPYRIPSGSMEPTLHGDPRFLRGDRVWVNKFVYGVRFPLNRAHIPFPKKTIQYADRRIWRGKDPQRWDIVVFKSAEQSAEHNTLIKRIVGLPGERIHIADGKIYANGRLLELPGDMPDVYYTSPSGPYAGMTYGLIEDDAHAVVPPDSYLVLGDNSAHSRDGRVWGWLPNEHIVGRAACIWWPPSRWRDFTGFSKTWWWRSLLAFLAVLVVVRLLFGRSWRTHPKAEPARPATPLHLYINRCAFGLPVPFTRQRFYRGRSPRRGELVLYYARSGENRQEAALLGRVAGMPGERVFLDEGKLWIDDAPLREPLSLASRTYPPSDETGPFGKSKTKQYANVPEKHYFILCDETLSEDTLDSRTVGWVVETDLVGIGSAVWWPPSRWARVG